MKAQDPQDTFTATGDEPALDPVRTGQSSAANPTPASIPHTLEAKLEREPSRLKRFLMLLGPGLITGAADDDPCAIGTYAQTGAAYGPSSLWLAPITMPMMAVVIYLSAKIGMVSGRGLAAVIREHYSRWVLYPLVLSLLIANIIEAGADIGAVAASIQLLAPVPGAVLVVLVTAAVLVLQIWGSYRLIDRIFKWLALALLSYVAAALIGKPDWPAVLRGSFVPTIHFDAAFLSLLVAVVGTTLSPYLYIWAASQQVEEEVAMGRRRLGQRRGATDGELKYAALDVNTGMIFSNLITYFIILCAASTLYRAGGESRTIQTAAEAAAALRPLAGNAATLLFAAGIVGVGFLAIPVMTTGAAYALADTFDWRQGLDAPARRAPAFYAAIVIATLLAMTMNFLHINAMKALIIAAVIQGFVAPPLLIMIMLITRNRAIMGNRVNSGGIAALGWITTAAVSGAAVALVWTWARGK